MKNRRKRLIVDQGVQVAILKRVAMYWLFCYLYVMLPVMMVHALTHPTLPLPTQLRMIWSQYWMPCTFSLLLLPMALLDALRLSHGFVGPVARLRRELGRHQDGTSGKVRQVRAEDFWGELSRNVEDLEQQLGVERRRTEAAARSLAGETA